MSSTRVLHLYYTCTTPVLQCVLQVLQRIQLQYSLSTCGMSQDEHRKKQLPCRHTCGCIPDSTKPHSLSRYSSSPSSSSLRYLATDHGNRRTHEKTSSVHPNCTTTCEHYKDVTRPSSSPSSCSASLSYLMVPLPDLATMEHHT